MTPRRFIEDTKPRKDTKPRQHFTLWRFPKKRVGRGELHPEGNVVIKWLETEGRCCRLLANLNEAMFVIPNIDALSFHDDPLGNFLIEHSEGRTDAGKHPDSHKACEI